VIITVTERMAAEIGVQMEQVIRVLDIIVWPAVVLAGILIFKTAAEKFLGSANLAKINMFGVEVEISSEHVANLIWESFDHFEIGEKQWRLLVLLSEKIGGLSQIDAAEKGFSHKEDFRPLRNAGLLTGDGETLSKSERYNITPLGKFVVSRRVDKNKYV